MEKIKNIVIETGQSKWNSTEKKVEGSVLGHICKEMKSVSDISEISKNSITQIKNHSYKMGQMFVYLFRSTCVHYCPSRESSSANLPFLAPPNPPALARGGSSGRQAWELGAPSQPSHSCGWPTLLMIEESLDLWEVYTWQHHTYVLTKTLDCRLNYKTFRY